MNKYKEIKRLTVENDVLKAKVVSLEAERDLQSKREQLYKIEVKHLSDEVSALKETLAQMIKIIEQLGHKKNSSNSSLPPSSDMTRKNRSLREKSDKKSGGQPGHKGNTLRQSKNQDIVTDLKSNFCSKCGQDLTNEEFHLKSSRQILDIPAIKPFFHEYRQYSCTCSHCHKKQVRDYPHGVSAPIQYGENIQSFVSYLSAYQCIPYARLTYLFSDLFNVNISEGSIQNLLITGEKKVTSSYDRIKRELSQSEVIGSDETVNLENRLNEILVSTISKKDYPKTHTLLKSMLKLRSFILPCIYKKNIPPDNNASERGIRNVKIKEKISGQFKTGVLGFCKLRSVIDTCIKGNQNIITILRHIMALNYKLVPE